MRNGWYPGTKLGNPNVPEGAEIYGSLVTMSGEIITTFYCQRYDPPHPQHGRWALWKVDDWTGSKPQPFTISEIKKYMEGKR